MLLFEDPVRNDFELNMRFDFTLRTKDLCEQKQQKWCERRRVFSIETSRTHVQMKIKRKTKTKTKEFDFSLRTKNVAKKSDAKD